MVTVEEFDALAKQVSLWGKWGSDDQRGTLNFITPEVLRKASAAVVSGEAFTLAMDLSWDGPQDNNGVPGRINPIHTMIAVNAYSFFSPPGSPHAVAFNDDIVVTPTQTGTHWDALAHVSHRGQMYNGFPADAVTASGAGALGIESLGVVASRGILLDVARHIGVDCLPRKFHITRTVLEEVEEAQGQPVEEGDIVLVRTGLGQYLLDGDIPGYRKNVPALDYDAPLFLHARKAAAIGIDNMPMELLPPNVDEVGMPVHILCLVMMGMPMGENFVLEDLARACAQDRRYRFLLSATPERFVRSTGGMVNPIAIR